MTTVDNEAPAASPVTDPAPEAEQPRRRLARPVWRRGLVAASVGAVALTAGVAVWLWGSPSTAPAPIAAEPAATATVERGTIAATDSWDGTLGHGSPFTVVGVREGVVTWLPGQGESVERGDALFRIDERPVFLLYGEVPMFRDLGPGDSGTDVEQLQANLAELGHDGFTVDGDYTESTAEAVRAWRAEIGMRQRGTVSRGDVVFVPEGSRVGSVRAEVGAVVGPGTPVLELTGADQIVSLEAAVGDRDWFEVGTEVAVLLPGGDELAGTVAATAVVDIRAEGPGGEADTESVLQVEVTLSAAAPDEFVGASAEVVVAVDERTEVLLVPVNALLARSGGGYGLEVIGDDGSSSIVAVETGLFAAGKVEIRSGDVAEGMVVGVAGR